MYKKNPNPKGFTLVELLVVIAIISLLSSVVLSSLNSARAKARDAKRKQDMIQIRNALEMYRSDFGVYPMASPGAWGGVATGPCGPGNSPTYIAGIVPTYMDALPVDPSNPASNSCGGYLYNSDGTNYKLLTHGTAESYPSVGSVFYDPVRPTWAWMFCSGEPACSTW